MKTYYWKCERNGKLFGEGKYSFLRRMFGRIFLGERFSIIGLWYDHPDF